MNLYSLGFVFKILSLIGRHKNVSAAANRKITRFIVPPITDKIYPKISGGNKYLLLEEERCIIFIRN